MIKTAKPRSVLMGASAMTASIFVMAAAGEAAAQNVSIGGPAGSTESRSVGAGQTLTVNGFFYVGESGNGTLDIVNGGVVRSRFSTLISARPNAVGAVTLSGIGSTLDVGAGNWLEVGLSGRGHMTISDGGRFTSASGAGISIGGNAAANGALIVTGAGSSLTTGGLIDIGYWGQGELTVSNGAKASAGSDISIGAFAGSNGIATVTGVGSALNAGRDLYVGNAGGNGQLTVSAGGVVNVNGRIYVGNQTGSRGSVLVTGAGSSLVSTGIRMDVGIAGGQGDLTVSDGGTVAVERLGILRNGVVLATGPGSSVNVTNWIDMANGTITVTNGAAVKARSSIDLAFGATDKSTINLSGSGSFLSGGSRLGLGINGTGELNIRDGARVDIQGGITLAQQATAVGTLTVGGASGTAAAGAGMINSDITFGAGNGLLIFNHNTAGYGYTGSITGGSTGRIRFENGLTTFNTTGTAFTGVSEIRNGAILNLNGSLGGVMNLLAGGELRGVGTVGVLSNAGTLRIGGDSVLGVLNGTRASFASGSTLAIDYTGGSADRLVLTGAADIASGSILSVSRPTGAVWRAGDRATFLTATGGLTGRFTLQNNTPLTSFLSLRDGYTANTAYLEIYQARDFAAAAQTTNQSTVAGGVQSLGSGTLFSAIANMPNDASTRVAFDALSGELHPGVRTVVARDGYRLQQAVIRNGSIAGARDAGARVWGEAWTSDGETEGNGSVERLDHDSTGFIGGADLHLGDGWRLGAALAFDQGDVESGRGQGKADLSRRSVLAYVDGQWGSFSLKGGVGYTDLDVETRRAVTFASPGGAFNETLTGDYGGGVAHAYVDASYPLKFGDAQVAPFVNLSRGGVSTDAHSEAGGLAALNVKKADADLTFSTLGLRVGGLSFAGVSITGSAGWRSAAGDRDAVGRESFQGGADFQVRSREVSRNSAVIDLAAEWKPLPSLSIGAGASYVGGDGGSDQGARLTLRYSF